MKLLTTAQHALLVKNGLPENRDKDHYPVVKLFLPGTGCTWLLNEIEDEENLIAFGLCDLGMSFPELGSVDFKELTALRSPLGLKVERDFSFTGKHPLSKYAEAARAAQCITEDF
jgi:hypothetical protein